VKEQVQVLRKGINLLAIVVCCIDLYCSKKATQTLVLEFYVNFHSIMTKILFYFDIEDKALSILFFL
jgi:hypothetical protein